MTSSLAELPIIALIDDEADGLVRNDAAADPADIILTCANCGARMDQRTCKLICPCGYFLSCSDYY
jgi:hypothetical protein